MQIKYNSNPVLNKVDVSKLRPDGSYDRLIENRTHPIKELISNDTGDIPNDLLTERACPGCGSTSSKTLFVKDYFPIDECSKCNLVYVKKLLKQSHYKDLYRSKDFQKIMKDLGAESHIYRVNRFGKERVEAELEKFLEFDFFPRVGGGIGMTRMIAALDKHDSLAKAA